MPRVNTNLAANVDENMSIIFYPSFHDNLTPHRRMNRAVVLKGAAFGKGITEGVVTG
jgi:hypothetical protein